MRSLGSCISLTTGVVVIYVVVSTLPVAFPIVFWLFLLSQALLIWMVVRILKAPRTSTRTFETHFYEDAPFRPGE
jgi:threonine/homoserine/homoserine lactone efflux protein